MNKHIQRLQAVALDRALPETWTTLNSEQLNKFTSAFAMELIQNICDMIDDCAVDFSDDTGLDAVRQDIVEKFEA
ncbi:hypothetical protein UFOVP116_158 [uncultured Caudovirales phage]|uniref:Uncharacterized protein n=1 Tax=uncultured Caudovirales phage TaxID=2100421 RepID=A0A6J5L9Z8_9CAUD|nr:hypothetical protein UFOVP116_158 [uncultured Caudovirales phage]